MAIFLWFSYGFPIPRPGNDQITEVSEALGSRVPSPWAWRGEAGEARLRAKGASLRGRAGGFQVFFGGVQENEKRKTYLIQSMNNGVNKDFSHEHMCFLSV